MQNTYLDRYQKDNRFRAVAKMIILIVTAFAAWISISIPISLRPSEYTLNIGDVTTQDILAPRTLTFTSEHPDPKSPCGCRIAGHAGLPAGRS